MNTQQKVTEFQKTTRQQDLPTLPLVSRTCAGLTNSIRRRRMCSLASNKLLHIIQDKFSLRTDALLPYRTSPQSVYGKLAHVYKVSTKYGDYFPIQH